jgi:hypothetical protein
LGRTTLAGRLDRNVEKYAGGWNVTARMRCRKGRSIFTSLLAYSSQDHVRNCYLFTVYLMTLSVESNVSIVVKNEE